MFFRVFRCLGVLGIFVLVFGECLGIFKGVWQIFLGCQSMFLGLIGEGRVFVRVFLRFGRFLEVFGEGGAVSKFRGEKGGVRNIRF